MAEVVWSDAALFQLVEIRAYIAIFDPPAADRIIGKLTALGNSLADFPNRGRLAADNVRELTVVAPYVMVYQVTDAVVTILRIRHGRQRPPAGR